MAQERVAAQETDQNRDVFEVAVLEDPLDDPQRVLVQMADCEILVPEETL